MKSWTGKEKITSVHLFPGKRFNPEKCFPLQVIKYLGIMFLCCLVVLGFYNLMWFIFMPGQYLPLK